MLESIAFEVTDLVETMNADVGASITELRVDGGASVSDFLLQFQADLLRIPVDRPRNVETTAFGAASLAGLAVGVWDSPAALAQLRQTQRVFTAQTAMAARDRAYRNWKTAVSLSRAWGEATR